MTRIAIDPLTRVEGHGKITLQQDEQGRIGEARLHIVEFRGFEKFIQGRPWWEAPVLVQRLCGICPVSHHLAAAKAMDDLSGVTPDPVAVRLRRLMHYGQVLQSHALHFFHLASPDLLFGYDDAPRHRNIVGLAQDHPDLAMQGIRLRQFGQQVIEAVAGKRIHGVAAITGGVNRGLERAVRDELRQRLPEILDWAQQALALIERIFDADRTHHLDFACIETRMMGLVDEQGALELYEGRLRVIEADGSLRIDGFPPEDYLDLLAEHVEPWSYMKFPFLRALGAEQGWYRVGPLARVNLCDRIPTPLADAARQGFMALGEGRPVQASLAYHWARLVELLHCAEVIGELLEDDRLLQSPPVVEGEPRGRGIGVIEAPRGTLIHHYEVDDDGLIERANLIVSTTHNNRAMNESLRQVAQRHLDGRELTEPLLNLLEVAVRAYDPCLSCATHALGAMPLAVELLDASGRCIDRRLRDGG